MNLPFAKPDLHEANLWLEIGSPKSFKDVTPSDLECALTYFFTGLTQHSDAQQAIEDAYAHGYSAGYDACLEDQEE